MFFIVTCDFIRRCSMYNMQLFWVSRACSCCFDQLFVFVYHIKRALEARPVVLTDEVDLLLYYLTLMISNGIRYQITRKEVLL